MVISEGALSRICWVIAVDSIQRIDYANEVCQKFTQNKRKLNKIYEEIEMMMLLATSRRVFKPEIAKI